MRKKRSLRQRVLSLLLDIGVAVLGCASCGIVSNDDPMRIVSMITDENIAKSDINLEYKTITYSGQACTPEITVVYDDQTLVEDVDYTLTYENNVNAGEASVVIEGIGDFRDSATIPFTIEKAENPLNVQQNEIELQISGFANLNTEASVQGDPREIGTLTYSSKTPDALLISDNGILTPSVVGPHYVLLTASGDENHKEKTELITVNVRCDDHSFKSHILPATSLEDGHINNLCTACGLEEELETIYHPHRIKLSKDSYAYNGKIHEPKVYVYDVAGKRIDPANYDVIYADDTSEVGDHAVNVSFKKNYTGNLKQTYEVRKADQKIRFKKAVYNKSIDAKAFAAAASLKTGDGEFTYSSSNPSVADVSADGMIELFDIGHAEIEVTASGTTNYNETTRIIEINVKPNRVSNFDLDSEDDDGSLHVTWKKQNNVDGYQIRYSRYSDFTNDKIIKISKSNTSKTLTGLSKGARYYVQVRAYTSEGGKTYYSSWSSALSKVTKEPVSSRSNSSSSSSQDDSGSQNTSSTSSSKGDVLVTPTGSCYHNHICGRGNYYWTSYEDAIARGLRPCKKCY